MSHVSYILLGISLFIGLQSFSQERRRIQIDTAGFLDKNEEKFPGATILTRDDMNQVKISHEGAILWCDRAIHYTDQDFIEAYGNVKVKQGDTINMTSKYVEYSGRTKLAFASGDVVLTDPTSQITTDTLFFDRIKQEAYYTTSGKVIRDSSVTITSQIGRYYMQKKKYQFVQNVNLINEEYLIESDQLDFYSNSGHAFLFGPTTITSEESIIYCEKGFYNTNNDTGYFVKNSKIDYENRIFEGDSMFFDRNRNFASASNNIKVTDTINKTVVTGHYAEVFRDKDSVFITKRALAIMVQEQDSIYIHGDTLMVTGKPENRITRAFYNVKLFKSNMRAKADSIHVDQSSGIMQLINLKRLASGDAFTTKRHPVLWIQGNQITGDSIHLVTNTETEKLDSLKVFNNAFIISKDTLDAGFNQIKGQKLYGLFMDNVLYTIDIIKNAESVYYLRNDKNELTGIDKSKSANMKIWITDNSIDEVRKLIQTDGATYPESEFPKNDRILRGFAWRESEKPKSVEDLFIDDLPLDLPIIKGLEDYIPQDDFFDDELLYRINESNSKLPSKKENKAARNIPKDKLNKPRLKPDQKLNKANLKKIKKDQN